MIASRKNFFTGCICTAVLLAAAAIMPLEAAAPAAMPTEYSPVIETYRRAMAEHWEKDWDKLEEHGIPIEFRYGGRESKIVAALIDIDADGSPELVIYDVFDIDLTSQYMLWNAYTLKDGAAVRLFVGAGRNRWYITRGEDGAYLFENEGSSGAGNSVSLYYSLMDGALAFEYGIMYDEDRMNEMNAKSPWFTTKTDPRGQDKHADLVPIAESDATAALDAYGSRRVRPEGVILR